MRSVITATNLSVELEQENDGTWLAGAPAFPGVFAHGWSPEEALAKVEQRVHQVISERAQDGRSPIDHRALLRKVLTVVGVPVEDHAGRFTPEELAELRRLHAEAG